jgi:hypothetical protein
LFAGCEAVFSAALETGDSRAMFRAENVTDQRSCCVIMQGSEEH